MDLFDLVVAKKLSGGEGGGSSDFSIANVTITSTRGHEQIYIPACINNLTPDIDGCIVPNIFFPNAGTQTYQIAMFKGHALASPTTGTWITSVSGSATLYEQQLLITGDCSITIEYSIT